MPGVVNSTDLISALPELGLPGTPTGWGSLRRGVPSSWLAKAARSLSSCAKLAELK